MTPYELSVALGDAQWKLESEFDSDQGSLKNGETAAYAQEAYPMDFYAHKSLGEWTPNHKPLDICENSLSGGCCGKCTEEKKKEQKQDSNN